MALMLVKFLQSELLPLSVSCNFVDGGHDVLGRTWSEVVSHMGTGLGKRSVVLRKQASGFSGPWL